VKHTIRTLSAGIALAVLLTVAISVLGYIALRQPVSRALNRLRHTDPVAVLHHDRAFMSIPAGARLWYEMSTCDSGQLMFVRILHASPAPASVRTRYEQGLADAGWSAGPSPHGYTRRMNDRRKLYVDVGAPDKHADVSIAVDVDQPRSLENC
jgi:hypothetical protein